MLPELEKVIEAFKEKLSESLVGVALFGSAARNEANPHSDLDIFLISDELPDNPFERQIYLREILPRGLGTRISIMAKTRDEFEQKLLPVYLDIAADGVILFDPQDYLKEKFNEVRKILKEEGLIRKKVHNTWIWTWEKPKSRDWELEWYAVKRGNRV